MTAAGGVGLGCALLVRHELALVTIPVGVWLLLEQKFRWRDAVRDGLIVAAPVVVALAVTAYYNVVRFGNPFDTGYLRDQTAGLGSFWAGAAVCWSVRAGRCSSTPRSPCLVSRRW